MSFCLMLHGIGPTPPHIPEDEKPYWITRAAFAELVELLRKTPASLTFDDGNETDASIALPALKSAGLTASFFILSDRIGRPGYLSEDQIREMHAAGMEIGSHGCGHLCWTKLGDAELVVDIARSIERLSAVINAPVRSVAIPYGDCDRRVLGVLRKLGVGRVYTSFEGPAADRSWLVRRHCIMAHMNSADVRAILDHRPDLAESTLNFLRMWRHTGNAALLRA